MSPALPPKVGDRIALRRDADRYPDFMAPRGTRAVVCTVSPVFIAARMDTPIHGAEPWGNELHWYDREVPALDHFLSETVAEGREVLGYWQSRGFDEHATGERLVLSHLCSAFDGNVWLYAPDDPDGYMATLDAPVRVVYIDESGNETRSADFPNSAEAWTAIIGSAFADNVLAHVTGDQFELIRHRNAVGLLNALACASEDYCDATALMADALAEFNWDLSEEADVMRAAWAYAKANFLTAADRAA